MDVRRLSPDSSSSIVDAGDEWNLTRNCLALHIPFEVLDEGVVWSSSQIESPQLDVHAWEQYIHTGDQNIVIADARAHARSETGGYI